MRFRHLIRLGVDNVTQNQRAVWVPWIVKLGLATVVIRILGRGAELGWVQQSGFFLWWIDFFRLEGQPPIRGGVDLADDLAIWVFFLLEFFLDAGVIGSLATVVLQHRTRSFFRYGMNYLGRFFRISMLGLLPAGAYVALSHYLLSGNPDLKAPVSVGPFVALPVFTIMVIFFVDVIADYARVQTVVEERTCMFLSWLSACRFVWQNPKWILGITLFKASWVLALLALNPLSNVAASWGTKVTGLVLLASLWPRHWLKAVLYAAQIELVRETTHVVNTEERRTRVQTERP